MSELHLAYPEQDVILRTGATRRRNYADLPFPARMDDVQADLLEERASEALQLVRRVVRVRPSRLNGRGAEGLPG